MNFPFDETSRLADIAGKGNGITRADAARSNSRAQFAAYEKKCSSCYATSQ